MARPSYDCREAGIASGDEGSQIEIGADIDVCEICGDYDCECDAPPPLPLRKRARPIDLDDCDPSDAETIDLDEADGESAEDESDGEPEDTRFNPQYFPGG